VTGGANLAVLSRILVGTDGSQRAEEAVRQGARLSGALRASLTIAFVIDTRHPHEADAEAEAEAALARASAIAEVIGVDAVGRVLGGDPERVLIEQAVEHGVDLLCVGPDAGVLGGAIRVGRVANHVLRNAPCSVLLAREAGPDFPRRIQCGVDGSAGSAGTSAIAAGIAAATGAELRLQHVVPVFRGDNAEWTLGPDEASPPEIDPAVEAARAQGVEPVREMAMGRPEHALVETSRRDEVDLVVVGHRGLSGVTRVLLGSVSEHVAAHAHCSVLVVRLGESRPGA
jgi:nucleotide-binding universal stress UspA family protein